MNSEKVVYRERKFLNKKTHHAGAYILVEITRWISAYKTKKNKKNETHRRKLESNTFGA